MDFLPGMCPKPIPDTLSSREIDSGHLIWSAKEKDSLNYERIQERVRAE